MGFPITKKVVIFHFEFNCETASLDSIEAHGTALPVLALANPLVDLPAASGLLEVTVKGGLTHAALVGTATLLVLCYCLQGLQE